MRHEAVVRWGLFALCALVTKPAWACTGYAPSGDSNGDGVCNALFQTAEYGGTSSAGIVVNASQFVGARFELAATTLVDAVQLEISCSQAGSEFGAALIPLSSLGALPSASTWQTDAVWISGPHAGDRHDYTADGELHTLPVGLTLPAGAYAVVVGTGPEVGALSSSCSMRKRHQDVGTPGYLFRRSNGSWANGYAPSVERLFIAVLSQRPDGDGDLVPDTEDLCTGDDATGDTDRDEVCDDQDACLGFDPSGCSVLYQTARRAEGAVDSGWVGAGSGQLTGVRFEVPGGSVDLASLEVHADLSGCSGLFGAIVPVSGPDAIPTAAQLSSPPPVFGTLSSDGGTGFYSIPLSGTLTPGHYYAFVGNSTYGAGAGTCRLLRTHRHIHDPWWLMRTSSGSWLTTNMHNAFMAVGVTVDECPDDPAKAAPGLCGCGQEDVDTDGDGALDCVDACPLDPTQTALDGGCPCGQVPDPDSGTLQVTLTGTVTTVDVPLQSYVAAGGPVTVSYRVAAGTSSQTQGIGSYLGAVSDLAFHVDGISGAGAGPGNLVIYNDHGGADRYGMGSPFTSPALTGEVGQSLTPKTLLVEVWDYGQTMLTSLDVPTSALDLDQAESRDIVLRYDDPANHSDATLSAFIDTMAVGPGACVADACPDDPAKTAPGLCGCGQSDADSDADGTADCHDACPADPAKTAPGACGCGQADTDADGDGFAACEDCNDGDPATFPGAPEQCDGVDNDCNGLDDFGAPGASGRESCVLGGATCLADGDRHVECASDTAELQCIQGQAVAVPCAANSCSDSGDVHGGGGCSAVRYTCAAGTCAGTTSGGADTCSGDAAAPSLERWRCNVAGDACEASTLQVADTCTDSGSPLGGGSCAATDWACQDGLLSTSATGGDDVCSGGDTPTVTLQRCNAAGNACVASDVSRTDSCAVVAGTCSATDWACQGSLLTATHSTATSLCGDVSTSQVADAACVASDGGASDTCVEVADTEAPSMSCTPPVVLDCARYAGTHVTVTASASDGCDAAVEVSNSANAGGDDASALWPTGLTAIVFDAVDDAGNAASCATSVELVWTAASFSGIAAGDLTVGDDAVIDGELQAGGTLSVNGAALVEGSAFSTGDLDVTAQAQVTGGVYTDGAASVAGPTTDGGPVPATLPPGPAFDPTAYQGLIADADAEPKAKGKGKGKTTTLDLAGDTVLVRGNLRVEKGGVITGPGTLVVSGRLQLKEGTTVGPNVTLIAGRDLDLEDGVTVGQGSVLYGEKSLSAAPGVATGAGTHLLSSGKIVLDSAAVVGLVLAEGDLQLRGSTTLSGLAVAFGALSVEDQTTLSQRCDQLTDLPGTIFWP